MDDTLLEQAIHPAAPPTNKGLSWRPMLIADGDELYLDGVCRGDVIRDRAG
ncbi:hypothetical protein [Microvirga splendida]|uniref:Uncharacterized protein n=1 Tax=Microvirga splendida TaxID=2795727 RepID=A0ABS0XZD8_9HYPH|nr:hypothetical protein [Microvirga splendida]MBJ6125417.1 hypothetical protein [Microvirga splendida]